MEKNLPPQKDEFEAAKAATERSVDQVVAFSKEQPGTALVTTAAQLGDMVAFSKSNAEAIMQATMTYIKGLEELRTTFFDQVQAQCQASVTAGQALMQCRSLPKLAEAQSEFTKKTIDQTLANGAKLTEIARKVAEETIAPLHQRIAVAVKDMPKSFAA